MKHIKWLVWMAILAVPGMAELPGNSIYQISSQWTNQDGKAVELKDFGGGPVLFSMVYLTCKFSCPTVISQVEAIQGKLEKSEFKRTKIVIVSFDPSRDTPQKLKAYMAKRKLDPQQWTFLTGKDDAQVRELAAAVNFKYEKSGSEYSHSFMILTLDKVGVMGARIDQANQDKSGIVEFLKKSLK